MGEKYMPVVMGQETKLLAPGMQRPLLPCAPRVPPHASALRSVRPSQGPNSERIHINHPTRTCAGSAVYSSGMPWGTTVRIGELGRPFGSATLNFLRRSSMTSPQSFPRCSPSSHSRRRSSHCGLVSVGAALTGVCPRRAQYFSSMIGSVVRPGTLVRGTAAPCAGRRRSLRVECLRRGMLVLVPRPY